MEIAATQQTVHCSAMNAVYLQSDVFLDRRKENGTASRNRKWNGTWQNDNHDSPMTSLAVNAVAFAATIHDKRKKKGTNNYRRYVRVCICNLRIRPSSFTHSAHIDIICNTVFLPYLHLLYHYRYPYPISIYLRLFGVQCLFKSPI